MGASWGLDRARSPRRRRAPRPRLAHRSRITRRRGSGFRVRARGIKARAEASHCARPSGKYHARMSRPTTRWFRLRSLLVMAAGAGTAAPGSCEEQPNACVVTNGPRWVTATCLNDESKCSTRDACLRKVHWRCSQPCLDNWTIECACHAQDTCTPSCSAPGLDCRNVGSCMQAAATDSSQQ